MLHGLPACLTIHKLPWQDRSNYSVKGTIEFFAIKDIKIDLMNAPNDFEKL